MVVEKEMHRTEMMVEKRNERKTATNKQEWINSGHQWYIYKVWRKHSVFSVNWFVHRTMSIQGFILLQGFLITNL